VALDQLRKLVRSALQTNVVQAKGEAVVEAMPAALTASFLLGGSNAIQHVRGQIVRLARSMAPVIITGESGSGKELAAREIHRHSARENKPFIAVNCGAIPETLMEAEFFGYRKGAFTGAVDDRDGFFQAANGGTLMLDEVADLPLAMQVKLLRAIQERRVRKVGATTEEPVDVRIISATHQNLTERVETGKFRQDLYYRLNVIELHLPPLRERLEDIGELAAAILKRLSSPDELVVLHEDALHALANYEFPGNVRELENILERALAFANHGCIQTGDLALRAQSSRLQGNVVAQLQTQMQSQPQSVQSAGADSSVLAQFNHAAPVSLPTVPVRSELTTPGMASDVFANIEISTVRAEAGAEAGAGELDFPALPCSMPDFLDTVEREMIRRALQQTRNNRTQAAELLGVSFRHLRYQIQKLQIQDPE
jgi:two-component system response regulator PilR (NtrC family)